MEINRYFKKQKHWLQFWWLNYPISGVTLGEGTGATMSDDEDDMPTDFSMDQAGSDAHDMMGFGLPTESERSLMERVRQELKIELKQVNQL